MAVTAIGPRLTPESVRRAEFGRTGLGRRGYSEADVEQFRTRVVQEIGQANAEKAELRREQQRLRAEVQRLRDYYRQRRIDVDNGRGPSDEPAEAVPAQSMPAAELVPAGPTPDAINVMSQAQQAADQHIAQAEDYARRLVSTARKQYEEILLAAHDQAEALATEAREVFARATRGRGAGAVPADLEQLHDRATYLRTFAQVTQVQLRSMLDGLRTELDKFSVPEVEAPPSPAPAPPTGRPLGQVTAGPEPEPAYPGASASTPPRGTAMSPETGPMRAVATPPRGFPARGTLPVRTP